MDYFEIIKLIARLFSPVYALGFIMGIICYKFIWYDKERKRLEKVVKRKQTERQAELKRLSEKYNVEDSKFKEILALQWDQLINALQKRKLTAVEVLEAFTAKAVEATGKFNNVTDFIPQAIEWARELDALEKVKGPLHGIPFCVKDDHNVAGMDSTLGFAKHLYQPEKETAVLVQVLKDLGAVPFCKTNVPQTMRSYGSDNPIFGTTVNATNPKLSPGGSSSGTGSLVGAHGAWFGPGTDIGGSIRIPAHFNGIATIKPTCGRMSTVGLKSGNPNLVGIKSVPGIIGRNADVVATVFKGISEGVPQHKYDCQTIPVPWNEGIFTSKKKLRIGYFTNLPFFPLMGDTENVIFEGKAALESMGHTLVPVEMPDGYEYMETICRFIFANNSETLRTLWKGERVAKSMKLIYLTSFIPLSIQRLIAVIMKTCKFIPKLYSKRTAVLVGTGAKSCDELWEAEGKKKKIVKGILEEWTAKNINAVICPVFPFPAPLVDIPGKLPVAVVYSMIWNLVDFPAGVVPFGKESGKKLDDFNCEDDAALKLAKGAIQESVGAPIGVQIVGRPFYEEIVLRLMCELEQFQKINY